MTRGGPASGATILVRRLVAGGLLLAVVVLVVALARGGSEEMAPSEQDERAIRGLIDRYLEAIGEGDAGTICRELIEPGQLAGRGVARCIRTLERGLAEAGEVVEAAAAEAEIERIEVTDERLARVRFRDPGGTSLLIEVDGEWYVRIPDDVGATSEP